jgi:hypothetical protein
MADVFLDTLNIDAACPAETVNPINQQLRIQGRVDYRIVNTSGDDALSNIVVTLSDSVGHDTRLSETLRPIPANSDLQDSHLLVLDASYAEPGRIGVTMRIEFSGAISDSKIAECNFVVGDSQAPSD